MKSCNIIITTENNGKKTQLKTKGTISFFDKQAEIVYYDGENRIKLLIGNTAVFSRSGDYGYILNFDSGKILPSEITINENTGTLPVKTLSYCHKIEKTEVKIFLVYILYGAEKQKFTVKISVSVID